ncbi:DUF2809 domain-containing protein [Taibaiella sp. KBW10]|uniref:ribosomal maturation YjgA family protein n=1 Tax=Taibaiella sp. KBW10 TaxID=2153357 RepID=UPI000F5A1E54|nr:DUF2809 domain-containing protein [Taibaiella sp. KBW10]RQO31788.1 DUF2809 domain-containing protein [Taibaiella sp. KBW10]
MKPKKTYYFIAVIVTVILGLWSRQLSFVPLWTGDLLYAVMCYLGFRFLFTGRSLTFSMTAALLFCFGIEFLQLWQHPVLLSLRHTLPGRLILGQGFLWTDLLAYTVGIVLIYWLDRLIS